MTGRFMPLGRGEDSHPNNAVQGRADRTVLGRAPLRYPELSGTHAKFWGQIGVNPPKTCRGKPFPPIPFPNGGRVPGSWVPRAGSPHFPTVIDAVGRRPIQSGRTSSETAVLLPILRQLCFAYQNRQITIKSLGPKRPHIQHLYRHIQGPLKDSQISTTMTGDRTTGHERIDHKFTQQLLSYDAGIHYQRKSHPSLYYAWLRFEFSHAWLTLI